MNDRISDRDTINLAEYLWLLRRGKWIILAFVVVSVAVSVYITLRTDPVYKSTGTFIYKPNNTITRALDMSGGVSWFEVETYRNDQIEILNSRSLAEAVADSILRSPDSDSLIALLFEGAPPPGPRIRGALAGMARGRTSASIKKDTDFFVLSATGHSPASAAALANVVMHTYYKRNLSQSRGENREVREFLEEQMELMADKLENDEDSLRAYKERFGLADLDAETRSLVNHLASIQTMESTASTAMGEAEARLEYLGRRIDNYRADLGDELSGINTPHISRLQDEISRLETARLELLSEGESYDSPVASELERQLEDRRAALAEALRQQAEVLYPADPTGAVQSLVSSLALAEADYRAEQTRTRVLSRLSSSLEDSLSQLPEMEMRLARLERNRQVSENIYILLRTKYEETRISEVGQIGDVTIVDTALPGSKIKPSKRRNVIMGLLVGLALGVGTVFLKEQLDTSIKNPEDVENLDIPVIGVIPRIDKSQFKRKGVMPITHSVPRSPASEAYRDLRTSLRFAPTEEPIRSILVTSAGPREGKSMTVANLAVTIAQTGRKVLIVDTDLRRPVMHNIFGLEREPGVSEVVAGMNSISQAVKPADIENLFVLTCGYIPHNPAELVGSVKMRNLSEKLLESYDFVLYDSPPVAVVTDPILISSFADSTLVVVMSKLADRKVLKSAWSKLQRTAKHLSGAIVNGFDPLNVYTSYGYYTYRYHYYYSQQGKRKRKVRTGDLPHRKK
ncbi:polysaccharide biosynthesis tyrosine autokinase [Candidatus Fermentibacteria bacterium]|nr:polysaccharide biosynthesis tyrosine autokinase [Candidatus Fermentibacteria bacterium]